MSEITKNNYEAFYLDYLEGTLSPEDTAQFLLFLENNPELKEDMEVLPALESPQLDYDKTNLYKDINANNVEEYIIASLEDQLSEADENELKTYLNSFAEAAALATSYTKTKLVAPEIQYPHKEQLKKREGRLIYLIPLASAAAVALFFILFNGPEDPGQKGTANFAQTTDNKAVEEEVSLLNPVAQAEEQIETSHESEGVHKKKVLPVANNLETAEESVVVKERKENREPVFSDEQHANQKAFKEASLADVTKKEIVTLELAEQHNSDGEIPTRELLPTAIANVDSSNGEEQSTGLPKQELLASVSDKKHQGPLKLGQWVNKNIRKHVLGQKEVSTEKIEKDEIVMALANSLDKSEKASASYGSNATDERSINISIGKFAYSKKIRR